MSLIENLPNISGSMLIEQSTSSNLMKDPSTYICTDADSSYQVVKPSLNVFAVHFNKMKKGGGDKRSICATSDVNTSSDVNRNGYGLSSGKGPQSKPHSGSGSFGLRQKGSSNVMQPQQSQSLSGLSLVMSNGNAAGSSHKNNGISSITKVSNSAGSLSVMSSKLPTEGSGSEGKTFGSRNIGGSVEPTSAGAVNRLPSGVDSAKGNSSSSNMLSKKNSILEKRKTAGNLLSSGHGLMHKRLDKKSVSVVKNPFPTFEITRKNTV